MNRSGADFGVKNIASVTTAKTVTQKTVKLCALCGTLNHQENAECWTCRWHGEFSRDDHTISLAWQRLELLYEEVRLEHVTSQKMRALGDFGVSSPRSGWAGVADRCRTWWRNFQDQRDLRMAQRAARLHSRISSRPDQLGV